MTDLEGNMIKLSIDHDQSYLGPESVAGLRALDITKHDQLLNPQERITPDLQLCNLPTISGCFFFTLLLICGTIFFLGHRIKNLESGYYLVTLSIGAILGTAWDFLFY